MKARLYWTYAMRSLMRGGQRSLLAIFCVAVGVMAIVALQLVSNEMSLAFTGNVRALNGGDISMSSATTPLTTSDLSSFDQWKAQGTISAYTAVVNTSGEFHLAAANGVSRFFQVEAVDPSVFPLDSAATMTTPRGGSLVSLVSGSTVVITAPMAQILDLKVGDTEHLYTRDGRSQQVTIGGIVQDTGLFQGSLLLINRDDFTSLPSVSGLAATYTAIYADVPSHSDANAASAEKVMQARFPLATLQTTKQALASNQAQVQQIEYFLQLVGLLALLIGGVGIVNTMQVLLRRRRTEIAVLKTIGYRRGDLYALFGAEAGLIGLVGGALGAAAGIGASFVVRGPVESSSQIVLPTAIDPQTVLSGVAIGFFTALIFGLLPIVQAAQIRPQSVLRESAEGVTWRGRILTGVLFGLLVVLFFALSVTILRNVNLAAIAVSGTGAFLIVLSLLFGAIVFTISKLPVYERFGWRQALLFAPLLLAAIALTVALPSFGALCLIIVLASVCVTLAPRAWKANVKLALRNIGRQKARTITTLLALFIGVFSIGLILVMGQNISTAINAYLTAGNGLNSQIIASSADRVAVERQLAQQSYLKHEVETSFASVAPVAVNGESIGQFARQATANGKYPASAVADVMNGAQGYALADGVRLDAIDTPLSSGRGLTASDSGTFNALLPVAASQAPTNLKLGDTITVISQADHTPITLTIVGFYTSKLPQLGPLLTDSGVVDTLSAGTPQYGFRMRLDPKHVDATLATIQEAVPSIVTYNFTDFADQYAMLLNQLITVLVAVTSLAVLASVIIIANAVALAMLERRRELGILKAIGHTSRSVLGETLVENGIMGFTSATLALVVVVVAALALGKFAFNLSVSVPTPIVLGVVAATIAVCMVVAAAVAWRATRVRPVEVLRYE
ncbi:MAG TPA: FtsX-like permease family protein [Ktedonobacterales bacterium]